MAKRKRNRIFAFLVFGLIGALLIAGYLNFFVISNNKVQKAKETEIPEWVDKQIIHKHSTARTGILLDDIKNIVIHYVGNPNTSAKNNRDYFNKPSTGVS